MLKLCRQAGSGLFVLFTFLSTSAVYADTCQPLSDLSTKPITPTDNPIPATPPDITISDCRTVDSGTMTSGYINIVNGGTLKFEDKGNTINFYAKSILVEMGGSLIAGSAQTPFGSAGGKLNIGLWGAGPSDISTSTVPNYDAIQCQTNSGVCYPSSRVGKYCDAASSPTDPCQASSGNDNAYFQGYGNLNFDGTSYFGYKVLGVSYGGTLQLFGEKGVKDPGADESGEWCAVPGEGVSPDSAAQSAQNSVQAWADLSGDSWARLDADVTGGSSSTITLDRDMALEAGDQIVISPTDWHPGHHDLLQVKSYSSGNKQATLETAPTFDHNGDTYQVNASVLTTPTTNPNTAVDTRATVGLLTRDIRIQSMGSAFNQTTGLPEAFPAASECGYDKGPTTPDCFFGGHVIFRQGFASVQVQGVEFYQLGQGGRMGHYPVHFHLAKQTEYTDAFVKDNSVWDSNTRFVVLHATHDVTVARNVGYLSVGHGYFIEDGSEIDNKFCYNLGVTARASATNYFKAQDPSSATYRYVPPILPPLASPGAGGDSSTPTMFWMMNAYNDFVGNMASGLHGLGVCYWPLSSGVSGPSANMKWDSNSYADYNQAGKRQAPLKRFRGNGCSTAAYAIMTEFENVPMQGLASIISPPYNVSGMLPNISSNFYGTYLGQQCVLSGPTIGNNALGCATTMIDRFTTSFNWAQVNFGSIWLRPWNYVLSNSSVTDQLFGGVSFVSGGSPDQVLPHRLTITQDSIYVGSSVDPMSAGTGTPTAAPATGPNSPMGPEIGLSPTNTGTMTPIIPGSETYTFSDEGVQYYTGAFNPKRLITIYDGPFFADGNIFDVQDYSCVIKKGNSTNSSPSTTCGVYTTTIQPQISSSPFSVPPSEEVRVVNAGIGWKQPNGFYYPPAFAFRNTSFSKGSIRHNVIDQYKTYAGGNITNITGGYNINASNTGQLGGLTSIDFTTILNDLDGTLNGIKRQTGLAATVGMSANKFYLTPQSVDECNSFGTQTQPDRFVTTYLKGASGSQTPTMYRQYMLDDETAACTGDCSRKLAMADGGITNALTANGGIYYLDTSPLTAGSSYTLAHLFAADDISVTYQIYVGTKGFDVTNDFSWSRVDMHNAYSVTTDSSVTAQPSYDSSTGVLTVTLDNSLIASSFTFDTSDPAICEPRDICQVNTAKNACTISDAFKQSTGNIGLHAQVESICANWVTANHKQMPDDTYLNDCPQGGCFGFTFTLPGSSDWTPADYATAGQPLALTYPKANWCGTMVATDADNCPLPTSTICDGP